jgi:hypothetical protein
MPLIELNQEETEEFLIESVNYFAKFGQSGIGNAVPYAWLYLVDIEYYKFTTRTLCTIEALILNAADEDYHFLQREEFQALGEKISLEIDKRENLLHEKEG